MVWTRSGGLLDASPSPGHTRGRSVLPQWQEYRKPDKESPS
jgi:hypothetical protein